MKSSQTVYSEEEKNLIKSFVTGHKYIKCDKILHFDI